MSKKFKVIVNTGKAEKNEILDVTQGQGTPLRIKAQKGAKFQLVDMEKRNGVAPEYVKVKRVGKDLHIMFEDSLQTDVIIDDYYNVMPEGYNGVVGTAENGNFYEYIPEDPDTKGLIPLLAEGGQAVSVALGGAEVSGAGAAIGFLAFNPLLAALGLAGAGAAVAAAGTGTTATTTAGLAITNVADNVGNPDNGNLNLTNGGLTNDNTPTLTGSATAGSVVTIRDGATVLGSTTANAAGVWTFTPTQPLAEGSHSFTASTAANGANPTPAFTLVVDTVAPTVVVATDKTNLANGEEVTVRFTLSESSTDFTLADVRAVNGALSNLQGSGTNYTATFKPTAGATSAAITVDSERFNDAAGNANKDGAETNNTVSFSVGTGTNTGGTDTTPPTIAISADKTALANGESTTLRFTLSESSTNFVPGDVTVSGGQLSNWQGSGTNYTATFMPNANVTSAVVLVANNSFTDAANNNNIDGAETNNAVSFNVGSGTNPNPNPNPVDTTLPTIAVSADKTSLANGETTTLRFTLSEPSSNFVPGDVTVNGGQLSNWQGSGTNYTATFMPNAGVTSAVVHVANNSFTNAANNANMDGAETNNAVSFNVGSGTNPNPNPVDTTPPHHGCHRRQNEPGQRREHHAAFHPE